MSWQNQRSFFKAKFEYFGISPKISSLKKNIRFRILKVFVVWNSDLIKPKRRINFFVSEITNKVIFFSPHQQRLILINFIIRSKICRNAARA